MNSLDTLLFALSLLVITSIVIARASNNIGLPIMLLFLGVGMIAGSEGPGGIYFDNAKDAQSIGIISLIFILFSGGLETKWKHVRPVLWPAISLSTIGVLVTTAAISVFTHYVFEVPWLISLLLGAVISSTDAAAVFSILNTRNINLRGQVRPLLELESGTNDPMAVFLTISLVELITGTHGNYWQLLFHFVLEMGLGLAVGLGSGRLLVFLINKLRFPIDGFYTVFTIAFSVFIYAATASLHGSGFLAVYVAGLVLNHYEIVHKKTIVRFFDGIAWLAQIGMFLALGLLVFPSHLIQSIWSATLISLFLIFVARPLGVFTSLSVFNFHWREKALTSLIGLRGAIPIILATFPLLAGIAEAEWIFNVVFFIVITSAILQGWPLPNIAKWLRMDKPFSKKISSPIEFSDYANSNMELLNVVINSDHPDIANKSIVQLPKLKGSLVVTLLRNGTYFVPSGGTILLPGDELQVLTEKSNIPSLLEYFS